MLKMKEREHAGRESREGRRGERGRKEERQTDCLLNALSVGW